MSGSAAKRPPVSTAASPSHDEEANPNADRRDGVAASAMTVAARLLSRPGRAGSGGGTPGEPVNGADQSDGRAGASGSRAGRNLWAAIAVGVMLGAAILVSLLTVRQAFVGVVAVAVAVATIELAGALRRGAGIGIALPPVLVGGQAMIWLGWPFGVNGVFVAFVLTVGSCMAWRLFGGVEGYLRDLAASVLTAGYLPLFGSVAALLVIPDDGAFRVLCFMIAVVASDTGGYTAGVLFGRHPMAPMISPKKSWEGFAGSMVAGLAGGALAIWLLLDGRWYYGLAFGAAIVITATGGDLVESVIKRDLGVKDMGNLLPGHGGMMDRLDSLLPSAVVAWLLLRMFVPV